MADAAFKQKNRLLKQCAREALNASSVRSGLFLEKLEKDEKGRPLPSNNFFWSISHKNEFAGGVVSKSAIGIDIEKIKNISTHLFNRIVSSEEKKCFKKDDDPTIFFRCFTAKEAVLKAVGVGLPGLKDIVATKAEDPLTLCLDYKNIAYKVEHIFFNKYIATIVKDDSRNKYKVEWQIKEA